MNCTTKYPSRFQLAVNKLYPISEIASQGQSTTVVVENNNDTFSKHIGSQMCQLPVLQSIIILQQKFQYLITH